MDFENQDIDGIIQQANGVAYMYELDHDFHSIKRQQKAKTEFYDLFQKSIDNYIDGDWINAQSNA